jgi:hypothetical protein
MIVGCDNVTIVITLDIKTPDSVPGRVSARGTGTGKASTAEILDDDGWMS